MSNTLDPEFITDRIVHEGYWYDYHHRLAKNGELCLGTLDPKAYCNGLYAYSQKDPGDGMAFVIVDTNDPVTLADLLLKDAQTSNL